jgi:hypothetical protein
LKLHAIIIAAALSSACSTAKPLLHDAPRTVPRHLLLPSRTPNASITLDQVAAEIKTLSAPTQQALQYFMRSCRLDAADRDALISALLSAKAVEADRFPGHHVHNH